MRNTPARTPTMAQALAQLKRAQDEVARLDLERRMRRSIMRTEPRNRAVVKFEGTFVDGGQTYSFVAIRADHYRGARRWFVSQNNEMDHRPKVLRSPCTWVELVGFAVPGSIDLATEWRNLETGLDVLPGDAPYQAEILGAFLGDPTEGMSPGSYSMHDV